MSITSDDFEKRRLIPRLFTFKRASTLGEIKPHNTLNFPKLSSETFETKLRDWKLFKGKTFAIELLGACQKSPYRKNVEVVKAAEFILSNSPSKTEKSIAESFISEPSLKNDISGVNYESQIKKIKSELKIYNKDATRWVDLAFYYTSLGQNNKAIQCALTAIGLDKNNRFVLRAISRLFLHVGFEDQALYYLQKSNLVKYDPWIQSAELSVAGALDVQSVSVDRAKKILKNIDNISMSRVELATSFATVEIENGSTKKGKKLLSIAMDNATENSFAQTVWLNKNQKLNLAIDSSKRDFTFEGNSSLYLENGKFKNALVETQKWFEFQPFSSRPAVQGSYIASIALGDHKQSIQIIKRALLASPNNFLLNNNYAFSLIYQNQLELAEIYLNKARILASDDDDKFTVKATSGLLEFRKNNYDFGRLLYIESMSHFKKTNNYQSLAVCSYYFGIEEKRINSDLSEELFKSVAKLVAHYNYKELKDKKELKPFFKDK